MIGRGGSGSQRNLYLPPGWHQVVVHCTGSHVQVYRSENHFGPSELHVLKGVPTTHTQSANGGPCYTYSDQNIIQCGPSSNSNSSKAKIILVQACCVCQWGSALHILRPSSNSKHKLYFTTTSVLFLYLRWIIWDPCSQVCIHTTFC